MEINQERLVSRFTELAAIDGESFHERKVADHLIGEFRKLGVSLSEDDTAEKIGGNAGNLYGFVDGTGTRMHDEPVLFCAHMDTVSPGNGKQIIQHEDGTITSDHTTILGADDRAGIAVILEAFTEIREEGLEHPPLEFFFTVAEEVYGQGSASFDYTKIRSKIAFASDSGGKYGVFSSCEPTIISFEIHIQGKAAHAGMEPQNGINAIAVAGASISRIDQGWVNDHTTLNIGTIEGGSVTNAVPAHVFLKGEIRSSVQEDACQAMEQVRRIFREEAEKAGAEAIIKDEGRITAYQKDLTGPAGSALDRFRKALALKGETAIAAKAFGASDINALIQNGIDGLNICAPMHNVHTTEEYTTTGELVWYTELMKHLMTV